MSWLPIANRELRLTARRRKTYWIRVGVVSAASLATLAILFPSFRGLRPATDTGYELFLWLAGVAMLYALLAGVFVTADCLSEEKREGTLGLLFLAPLNGFDVVFGKLLATSLNVFYSLVALFPIMGLAMLLGGLTGAEFLRATLVLGNTLFLSLTAGMFFSALSRDGRKAILATLLMVAAMAGAPAAAFLSADTVLGLLLKPACDLISPATGFFLALESGFKNGPSRYWNNLVFLHALAWGFLLLAGFIVKRAGFEEVSRPTRSQTRLQSNGRRRMKAMADEANPLHQLLWRAPRRWPYLAAFVSIAVLAWLAAFIAAQQTLAVAEVVHVTMFALHAVIKIWVAWETTHWLADLRRSGELELLLVSPLNVQQIVQGHMACLRRRFLLVIVLVAAVDLALLLTGTLARSRWIDHTTIAVGYLAGLGLFLMDAYTICWVGFWQGLLMKHSARAFSRTLFFVLVLPVAVFLFLVPVFAMLTAGIPSGNLLVALWFGAGYLTDFILCGLAPDRCYGRFREAASA